MLKPAEMIISRKLHYFIVSGVPKTTIHFFGGKI